MLLLKLDRTRVRFPPGPLGWFGQQPYFAGGMSFHTVLINPDKTQLVWSATLICRGFRVVPSVLIKGPKTRFFYKDSWFGQQL